MPADIDEKTEPATPRRREEARTKGQVARSQDVTAAVLLLSGFIALAILGPGIWHMFLGITRAALTEATVYHPDELLPLAASVATEAIKRVAPFLIILFISMLLALLAQIGLLFTVQPLIPSLSKINPLSGFKRLFSMRSVMLAVANFGKLLVVSLVAYLTLANGADAILYAMTLGFHDLFALGSSLMFDLGMRLGAALLILAFLDFAWQRYQKERDLRMTKEEVKDELRSMDGDPQVKRRRRDVQLRLAMQRLRRDVPQADVIVTNPTHIAVAIQYEAESMRAPKVIAKGADHVALRIRQVAAAFGIPIVERKPLARALFESVEVGQYVPEHLYRAIAEILAYIYELTGRGPRGTGRRTSLVSAS